MRRPRCSSVSSVCVRGLRAPRPNRRRVQLFPVVYPGKLPPYYVTYARHASTMVELHIQAYAVDAACRARLRETEKDPNLKDA